ADVEAAGGAAVERQRDLALTVQGRVGAARFVSGLEAIALPQIERLALAGREQLGCRGQHRGSGGVGGTPRLHRGGQLAQRVARTQLLLDRQLGGFVFALAEVKPAQRPAAPPEEEARPSLTAVVEP